MEEQNKGSEIEFNSMAALLRRLDNITYGINSYRQRRNYQGMFDCLVDYFKELCGDLTDTELQDVQNEIKTIKNFLNPFLPENQLAVLNKLDNLDITLRRLGKAHGYTTSTKKDVRKTITEM